MANPKYFRTSASRFVFFVFEVVPVRRSAVHFMAVVSVDAFHSRRAYVRDAGENQAAGTRSTRGVEFPLVVAGHSACGIAPVNPERSICQRGLGDSVYDAVDLSLNLGGEPTRLAVDT